MSVTVDVRPVAGPEALHAWYQGQNEAQPAYVELGLGDGILLASYDAVVGPGGPASVHHGIDLRWSIPALNQEAADELLKELAPLAQRILDGSEVEWDGNNHVGRLLTEDAHAAHDAITERCEGIKDDDSNPAVLSVWTMDTIGHAWDADEAGITAETTDAQLAEIETQLTEEFRDGQDLPHVVIVGLTDHLRSLRDDLVNDED
ncbi:hypothetical protein ACQEVM_37795 [Streptomyces sp. CA-243310]|uniref:hypothetical protein n=1 Tax=Streptomyces sp. CA-243310 TaxID=3240056 RepID=UPI003D924344